MRTWLAHEPIVSEIVFLAKRVLHYRGVSNYEEAFSFTSVEYDDGIVDLYTSHEAVDICYMGYGFTAQNGRIDGVVAGPWEPVVAYLRSLIFLELLVEATSDP